jgi:hypothetical protein
MVWFFLRLLSVISWRLVSSKGGNFWVTFFFGNVVFSEIYIVLYVIAEPLDHGRKNGQSILRENLLETWPKYIGKVYNIAYLNWAELALIWNECQSYTFFIWNNKLWFPFHSQFVNNSTATHSERSEQRTPNRLLIPSWEPPESPSLRAS